ncbi:MAG TPA: helix-turn-helix domain-containing protein [candidate division Zixibacteria bacterium]|nr:helix-turn-helix domain-containing protein [candidate division Zixibacteria bacterium]
MIKFDSNGTFLIGTNGSLLINENDEITLKLAMLFEGECEGLGRSKAAKKYGYSRQRYHQILQQFNQEGAESLKRKKTGPKSNYRRTDEVVRQIIRHRFLDPDISVEVITQKLKQCGHSISICSVERVISDYGLQKKTSHLLSEERRKS